MKDQRSYFEKADFQSDLPPQLLTAVLGLTLVLLELAVAQWPIFYGSAPNLPLIFIYYMIIYHGKYMPIFTIFLMGIIGDFLLSNLLSWRGTSDHLYLLQQAVDGKNQHKANRKQDERCPNLKQDRAK